MSAQELLEMTESISSAVLETQAIRNKIIEEFGAASTVDERCSLLAMYKATMDIAEIYVAKSGNAQRLAEFKEARAADYARLLLKESSVGGNVSPETLLAVTSREGAAGRLTPDDATRLLARAKTQRDFDYTSLMTSALTDTQGIRDKIFKDFEAAQTEEQRCALLADLRGTMDIAEFFVARASDAKRLAEFKEAREHDYDTLLIKESCVGGELKDGELKGGEVSPEMLMRVTNREIAAGRLAPDDPGVRQLALKLAGQPHPSHAELLEKAEARKASDMSIESLKSDLLAAKNIDPAAVRERIYREFDAATTSGQRGALLAIFKAVMDNVERNLAARPDQAQLLEDFRKARAQDYNIFIVKECTVGLDTPVVGGDVSVDKLMEVTNREVEAGRMTEEHSLRRHALEAAAAPHYSHAELIEKHAKLKAEATAQANAPAPKPAADRTSTSYAVGNVLGRKLKGLFRK